MKKIITLFITGTLLCVAGDIFAGNLMPVENTGFQFGEFKRKTTSNRKNKLVDENRAFANGKMVFSLGYGGPNTWRNVAQTIIDSSNNPTGISASGLGPIHFRGEFALSDNVGLAASINYVSASVNWTSMNGSTWELYDNTLERSSLSILARLNFHFGVSEKLDPYFGFGMGYRTVSWVVKSEDPDISGFIPLPYIPFGFETTIGLRYYFTQSIGIYGEAGIAKSVGQIGLVVAF